MQQNGDWYSPYSQDCWPKSMKSIIFGTRMKGNALNNITVVNFFLKIAPSKSDIICAIFNLLSFEGGCWVRYNSYSLYCSKLSYWNPYCLYVVLEGLNKHIWIAFCFIEYVCDGFLDILRICSINYPHISMYLLYIRKHFALVPKSFHT